MASAPLTSFEEFRGEWEKVLSVSPANTLFLTPQWQEVWWEAFGDGKEMAGFYLGSPEEVMGIAPLVRSGSTLSFVGNTDTVDYNDFMIAPGYETVFFDTLLDSMVEQQCSTLNLLSLRESSPTLAFLPDLARQRGFSVVVEEEDVASGLELPSTWDAYLTGLSKKDRHELRRKFRRLESAANWRWYCLQDPEQVGPRVQDFIDLMRQSNQDKDTYMTPEREEFFHHVIQRMAQLGLLRLYFLEIDDKPVATSLCFDYASSRLLYNSGYDTEFGYYSVGLLLNALCLQEAIEQGMNYFDFLRGSEAYKAHLGGQVSVLYQMVVERS
ncbi:MAG: hypothetical protein BZY88_08035 [SAR202 cluster bacterium Io17-Chloro-G9]|nr:MAG: hypothetical protein BZY88_08035 [SAR202 cluster bacterium Io17-Chloro-G9]